MHRVGSCRYAIILKLVRADYVEPFHAARSAMRLRIVDVGRLTVDTWYVVSAVPRLMVLIADLHTAYLCSSMRRCCLDTDLRRREYTVARYDTVVHRTLITY